MKSARFAWLGQKRPWLTLLSWFISCLVSQAAANNSNTDWFQRAGYGVFVHYLEDLQNDPQQVHRYLGHDRLGNYLGAGWGQPGVRYSKADLTEYVAEVNRAGGVVSIDVFLDGNNLSGLRGPRCAGRAGRALDRSA